MAFDGLHIIWTTYHYPQPHEAKGNWSSLGDLYEQLAQKGFYDELSKPLFRGASSTLTPKEIISLSLNEAKETADYLSDLIAPDHDRIVGGLPVICYAVNTTCVQLLLAPAPPTHGQAIGRLKSKLASYLLRVPQRKGQEHIWSSGYWFANINGEEAITQVARFIEVARFIDRQATER